MLFLQTGRNYVGTPEGFISLQEGERIEDLVSLTQCEWEDADKGTLNSENLYKVITHDTAFSIVLYPNFPGVTPGGDMVNCVTLGDAYFNDQFVVIGKKEDLEFSKTMPIEIYQQVWGPDWDPKSPWYKRAWECREAGVEI